MRGVTNISKNPKDPSRSMGSSVGVKTTCLTRIRFGQYSTATPSLEVADAVVCVAPPIPRNNASIPEEDAGVVIYLSRYEAYPIIG